MTSLSLSSGGLSGEQAGELAAITRMLHLAKGSFSLSSVICNDPRVEQDLIEQLHGSGVQLLHVRLTPATPDAFDAVAHTVAGGTPQAILLTGIPNWLSDKATRTHRVRSFNASRELWERFASPSFFA